MATVLAIHVVLARLMPTAEFATFVLASSLVVFFSKLAMFGLNTLVCRYVAEGLGVNDVQRSRLALRLTAQIGTVTIAGVGLGGWWTIRLAGDALFDLPGLHQSAGLIALWIMILSISQILSEVFRGLHDLRMASILGGVSGGLAASLLFLIGIVLLSFVKPIHFPDVAVMSATSLVLPSVYAAVLLWRYWPRNLNPRIGVNHSLEVLTLSNVMRETFPMMLVQILSFGLAQLDIWIVGACCSEGELAGYGVARRLALLVAIPLTQVNLVVASSISELHAQGAREKLEFVVRGAATVSAVLTCLILVALVSFPATILGLTFGPSFGSAAAPLLILCWGQFVFALTGPCGVVLTMTGHQRLPLYSLIGSALLFLLAPTAAAQFGLEAVALISTVAIGIHNICQWIAVRILLGLGTQPSWSPTYVTTVMSLLFRDSSRVTV